MFIDITNPVNFDMMVKLYDFTTNHPKDCTVYMQCHDGIFNHGWLKCDSVEMRLRYDTLPNRAYSQSQILDLIHHGMMSEDKCSPTGFTIMMIYGNNNIKEEWRIDIPQNVHTMVSKDLNYYFDIRKGE